MQIRTRITDAGVIQERIFANPGETFVSSSFSLEVPGYLPSGDEIGSGGSNPQLEADVAQLQLDVGSLQTATGSLEADVAQLQLDVSSLQSATGSLESSVEAFQLDVGSLQTATGSLEADVAQLQLDVSSLQSATGSLESSVAILQADVLALQEDNTAPILKLYLVTIPPAGDYFRLQPGGGWSFYFEFIETTGDPTINSPSEYDRVIPIARDLFADVIELRGFLVNALNNPEGYVRPIMLGSQQGIPDGWWKAAASIYTDGIRIYPTERAGGPVVWDASSNVFFDISTSIGNFAFERQQFAFTNAPGNVAAQKRHIVYDRTLTSNDLYSAAYDIELAIPFIPTKAEIELISAANPALNRRWANFPLTFYTETGVTPNVGIVAIKLEPLFSTVHDALHATFSLDLADGLTSEAWETFDMGTNQVNAVNVAQPVKIVGIYGVINAPLTAGNVQIEVDAYSSSGENTVVKDASYTYDNTVLINPFVRYSLYSGGPTLSSSNVMSTLRARATGISGMTGPNKIFLDVEYILVPEIGDTLRLHVWE